MTIWTKETFLERDVISSDGRAPGSAAPRCRACLARGGDAGGLPGLPHFAPKAKRVIYLFQSGAPSQMDLFDYKPRLKDLATTELPESVRGGQRLTGMTSGQTTFPIAPSLFQFQQHGASGAWMSELMPHLAKVADELCFIKSMHTEAINHDPAITFFQTGSQLAGRPSIGAWLAYGLGSENQDLPAFVVMISQGTGNPNDQPLYDRLWGSGLSADQVSGRQVPLRSAIRCSILSNPPGLRRAGAAPDARRSREAEPDQARGVRRSGNRHAHRPIRDGLSHANLGAGTDRPFPGVCKHV